jgi:hypothetical protein
LASQVVQGAVAETYKNPAPQAPQVLSAAKAKLVVHVVQTSAAEHSSQFVEQVMQADSVSTN